MTYEPSKGGLLGELRRGSAFDARDDAARGARTAELVREVARAALAGSRFYRDRDGETLRAIVDAPDAPATFAALRRLAPLTKSDLASQFDAIVTDPEVDLAAVRAFDAAHPEGNGVLTTLRGTYNVKKTSGTSGTLVYQVDTLATQKRVTALVVMRTLLRTLRHAGGIRSLFPLPRRARVAIFVHRGNRSVYQGASKRSAPWLARALLEFHVIAQDESFESIRETLGRLAPEYVFALPSRLEWLAKAQIAGHLAIAPRIVFVGGETLHDTLLATCRAAWPTCRLVNTYGTTETKPIATACPECGELHVLEDIVHLELEDEHGRPVAPGEEATHVYATSLRNFTVPVLRYALGDRITLLPSAGCAWRTRRIKVAGREPAFLWVRSRAHGSWHPLNGRMLKESLVASPGLVGFAVRHDAPGRLDLSLVVNEAAEARVAETHVREALAAFTREHACELDDVLPELLFRIVDQDTWNREGGKLQWITSSVEPPELHS